MLKVDSPAIIWPWFYPEAPTFDAEKFTRPVNTCLFCDVPMVDTGHTQIIYSCCNSECTWGRRKAEYLDLLCCELANGLGDEYIPYWLAGAQDRSVETK